MYNRFHRCYFYRAQRRKVFNRFGVLTNTDTRCCFWSLPSCFFHIQPLVIPSCCCCFLPLSLLLLAATPCCPTMCQELQISLIPTITPTLPSQATILYFVNPVQPSALNSRSAHPNAYWYLHLKVSQISNLSCPKVKSTSSSPQNHFTSSTQETTPPFTQLSMTPRNHP